MNILSLFKRKPEVVVFCLARHDGGYLVRLSSGRHGSSPSALAIGAPAALRRTGVVEAVR
jgi:hypothetical protein